MQHLRTKLAVSVMVSHFNASSFWADLGLHQAFIADTHLTPDMLM